MADDLRNILDVARSIAPEVDPATWARVEAAIRREFGARRLYIASRKKMRQLQAIEESNERDSKRIGEMLGVSVRQARRLKQLV